MNRLICFLFLSGTILINSCANKVAPTGGIKDTKPPELVSAKPENYSTDFTGKQIVLTFNEYVQLTEIQKNVLVSPPLSFPPEIETRKKSIIINLSDTLLPNTTYSIYFGNAVTDFTEGNLLSGFQYVFSTGPVIDSLFVQGQVLDALTLKPVKNALVYLYDDLIPDTLIGIALPLYYARAAENGFFTVKNVRDGSYKMAAADDQNNNLTADLAEESFGVIKESHLTSDTLGVKLFLNRQPPAKQFIKGTQRENPGKLTTAFAKPVSDITFKFLTGNPDSLISVWNASRDTVIFYGKPEIKDSAEVIWFEKGLVIDTVKYTKRKMRDAPPADTSKKATGILYPAPGTDLVAESNPTIIWNSPLAGFKFENVKAFKDSVEIPVKTSFDDTLKTRIIFDSNFKEGKYKIEIPPGTAIDIYGKTNDTIQFSFNVPAETVFGSIAVNFTGKETENYIIQVVNEKDELQRQRNVIGKMEGIFTGITPGIYHLRVIEDENKNNRWDGGSWMEKSWPEKVKYYPDAITVRANWEVEINWKLPIE